MKKILLTLTLLLALQSVSYSAYTPLRVKEEDGAPNVPNVNTISVVNGTLTDQGNGKVLLTTGGGGGGGGTVTSVSVTTANGVSGSVATATSTPAISLSLGAITPTSVNGVTLSGSATPTLAVTGTTTVSGTNTGDQTLAGLGAQTNLGLTSNVSGTGFALTGGATPKTLTVTNTATVSGTNTGDQTLPVKASASELATATDDAKFATALGIKNSHNIPSVAPSTSGNVMTSNGTDWTSATPGTQAINKGGTGQTTAQAAIDALTDVASATNEYVWTKDTGTGQGQFKAPSGGAWTTSGSVDYLTTTSHKAAIGRTSLIGTEKFVIDGSTDIIQAIIRGNATQTPNILEVRKSDNSVLLGVSEAGVTAGGTTSQITDTNGNELLKFTATSSAVNELTLANAATGNNPSFTASGGDSNIGINLVPKGTGVVQVAGVTVPTISSTVTFTNKRVTPRIVTAASYTTDTGSSLNCDTTDRFIVTAQAGALKFNNPSGTPTDGQTLWIAVTGTAARALTWDTQFEASAGAALPTTTVTTARLDIGFIWRADTSKWHCVATA